MKALEEIKRGIEACRTYNFGMRYADKLAHEDADKLTAALDAVLELHRPDAETGKCEECTYARFSTASVSYPCPTARVIAEALA